MQTEAQIAAEEAERVDGAIASWMDKLVVDDPRVHVDMRVQDRPLQQERAKGLLKDPPAKLALKRLYRGKKPLTYSSHRAAEPSVFMHESTIEELMKFESSLRPHAPQKWKGTKDFSRFLSKEDSLLPQTAETKRSISLLTAEDRQGAHYTRQQGVD